MEYVNTDRYLDPPDEPTHGPCDGCGVMFDYGDLTKVGTPGNYSWLCDECLEAQEAEQE